MQKLRGLLSLSLILCLLLCLFPTSRCETTSDAISFSDAGTVFEQGKKVCRGAIKIVDLRGTWREMGRQYGYLLSDELKEVCAFVTRIMDVSEKNAESVRRKSELQAYQTPYTIRQFFAGMAETSGLTEEELFLANVVERVAGLPQCSAAAVWGDYAKDALVFGRNYDYDERFLALNNDVIVTVYHPADGSLATATVGYAGEIYAVNGLNEKGIFLELNNGTPSANIKSPVTRITGTTLLLDILFEADTLNYMELFFQTALCSSSYIINVADSQVARSYEWCPIGVERGDTVLQDGILVSTNHYLNPNWLFATPADSVSWQSITRRANLISLCEQDKGQIDAPVMMRIMETPTEEGGAMEELTVYQMIVVPERLTLWLKIVGAAPWTQIDMNSFLLAQPKDAGANASQNN